MTICYPQIITASICPRDELNFSLTPPDCVRVVPIYNDASYVISQFPPPVHFLIRDNGQVYQLADIQSPPSTPPEYHAILDSTGCILIGVELSAVTTVPLTNAQIAVLPGVLRHVLQTLGLSLSDVTNTLPPQRCRPQLWQQILIETEECLNTPPPPPPPPPGLTCSFVLSCISSGQNINISTGGIISAGQLVPGPNNGQYTWLSPNGTPLFTFNALITPLTVQDTLTVDLTLSAGNVLSADVNVSGQSGNIIQVLPDGLFAISGPCLGDPPSLVNLPTDGLLVTYNADTGCLEQIAIPPERVVYGEPSGSGSPRADNLRYLPTDNFLRATVGPDFPMQHSFMLYGSNATANGSFYSIIGAITNSDVFDSAFSFINAFNSNTISAVSSVVAGQDLATPMGSFESAVLFRESSISSVISSFVTANRATIDSALYSFVSGLITSHPYTIFGSLSVSLFSGVQPILGFSSYFARNTNVNAGTAAILFSNATLDSVNLAPSANTAFSTLHLQNVTMSSIGIGNSFSFIAASNANLSDIRYSFFSSAFNVNQTASASYSFVSFERQNSNRIGVVTPFIVNSAVIAVDVLPNALNSLFISRQFNRWLGVTTSVYVAANVTVYDSNPPNNTALLGNSLIVGDTLDVSGTQNVNNLILVGQSLRAGANTVFGVGYNSYTPAAVQAAGGWRAFIADGGADNANYFQGWDSAWRFRMFRPSTNYPNNAAAIAALNAAYGTDPRNTLGTMVVAQVASTPAIFTWNGTTFVRITV